MKRRGLVAVAILGTPLVVMGAACSFPDVSFGPSTGDEAGVAESGSSESGGRDTGTADVTVDTGTDTGTDTGVDAGDDASDANDASDADATTKSDADAGGASDADADTGASNRCPTDSSKPKCDCDDDGYGDVNCDVDPTTIIGTSGTALKPGDCDDSDNRRHPSQTFVSDVPPAGKDGNWDCVLPIEVLHPPITCGGTGLLGCSGTSSFLGTVACGVQNDLYSCQPVPGNALATCVATPTGGQITQACK